MTEVNAGRITLAKCYQNLREEDEKENDQSSERIIEESEGDDYDSWCYDSCDQIEKVKWE